MSRLIKLTPEAIEEYTSEFKDLLQSGKVANGKITYTKTLGKLSRKATVYFTDLAWVKMQTLIQNFDKEVAWHGVATRGEDEEDTYYISDILVYPQTVSGASVEMDVSKYDEWIREHVEDKRFYNIGMQGHSHVDMGVTPSGVDLNHQEEILKQLTEDMFYIFMIWNKSGAHNVTIYDLKKNILFENDDVDVMVLSDGYGVDAFLEEAKKLVVELKSTVHNYPYSGYWTANGYKDSSASSGKNNKASDKKDDRKESKAEEKKSGLKKGRKSKAKKSYGYSGSYYDDYYGYGIY